MTEAAALNRDIAKQHPENVFESPLKIVDEKLATLKRWKLSILGDLATSKDGMGTPGCVTGLLRGQLTVVEEVEEAKVRVGKGPLPA